MSAKIPIDIVAACLKQHKLEPSLLRQIIEELNFEAQPDPTEEKGPATKKQFVVIVSDPAGVLHKTDMVAWVAQIEESASPHSTMDRVFKAAYDFNASKKGRLLPVKTVGEAFESASAKYFKESEIWIKTKLPVAVVTTDNVLPKDEFVTERVDHRKALN